MNGPSTDLAGLAGYDLGAHVATFDDRDAILYALAVGAGTADLDLVFERNLRVLPTYGCALGLWAVEAAGGLGVYDRVNSLHAGQTLTLHDRLRPGRVEMTARVTDVWDKGRISVVGIEVAAEAFTAGYVIMLPGIGNWGGERGPSTPQSAPLEPTWSTTLPTDADAALLYRLTGDRHPVHVDPVVAGKMGFERPILHGLATLGISARALAGAVDAHPVDLLDLEARLTGPVLPGQDLLVSASTGSGGVTAFEVSSENALVLTGSATFG
ncbi:MAG TPA: MaoC/PaaZ C-terminal domain-containing protein [Acidimicrobiales bacterium]|nr:MaoC/PaaZ C-terminal domain-containing protein [Acidimicrobiales bacterium]